MKRHILLILMLLTATLSEACTNLIVGKKASVDGSVICTYNCDGFGFASSMSYHPAGQHEKEVEDYYANDQRAVEDTVCKMTRGERVTYLTTKTTHYTDYMMKRWKKLAHLLIVKHNDQIMRPSKDGVVIPGRYTSPQYPPSFIDAIKQHTGSRYQPREVIQRRQR